MSLEGYGSVFAAGNRALREAMLQREKKEREDFLLRLKLQEMEREARKDEEEARRYDEQMALDKEKTAYDRATKEREFAVKERDFKVSETERKRKAKLETPKGTKLEEPDIAAFEDLDLAPFIANRSQGVPVVAGLPAAMGGAPGPVVAFEGGRSGEFMGSPEVIEQERREGVRAAEVNAGREDEQAHELDITNRRIAAQRAEGEADRAARLQAAKTTSGRAEAIQLGVSAQERYAGMKTSIMMLDSLQKMFDKGAKDFVGPWAGNWEKIKARLPKNPFFEPARGAPNFASFTATLKNSVIKAFTGAQMSEPEAARLAEQIPLMTDREDYWQAKSDAAREILQYMAYRTVKTAEGVTKEELDAELMAGKGPATVRAALDVNAVSEMGGAAPAPAPAGGPSFRVLRSRPVGGQ